VVICLQRGADCLHMVQLPHLNPDWFYFLVPAYLGCPEKRPLNGCSLWPACQKKKAAAKCCICLVGWFVVAVQDLSEHVLRPEKVQDKHLRNVYPFPRNCCNCMAR